MADELDQGQPKAGAAAETPPIEPEKGQGNQELDSLTLKIAEMEKQQELLRKEISSRDKKVTELQKEKMSDAERIEAERKEEHEKNVNKFLDMTKKDLKLDEGFENLLGKDFDSIETNAGLLKQYTEKLTASKDAEIEALKVELQKYKASTGNPGQGSANAADLDSQLLAAKKGGDLHKATGMFLEKFAQQKK